MPLTPVSCGLARYIINYAATVQAVESGAAALMPDQATISMWFHNGIAWDHLLVRYDHGAIHWAVNNGTLVFLAEVVYPTYASLLKDVLGWLYGDYAGGWAEVVCLSGLHDAETFVSGAGAGCWPRETFELDFADPASAWLDFADPDAAGPLPATGGWEDLDAAVNDVGGRTYLDLTNPIEPGIALASLSRYVQSGYATANAVIGVYRLDDRTTGAGRFVAGVPLVIANTLGWHTATIDYTIPEDGAEYYIYAYSDRRTFTTAVVGDGMQLDGTAPAVGSDFSGATAMRAPVTRWTGYRKAGLGQDVSGNGNHWDLTATRSTSTPTS